MTESYEPNVRYAFQPIVDVDRQRICAYEALMRGPAGESAGAVLAAVPADELYRFDSAVRSVAIAQAMALGLECDLNLNLMPQGLFALGASALEVNLAAATRHGLPLDRIVIEVTEGELIDDHKQFAAAINPYRAKGVKFAIDDFGAGYSGLNLLAAFQPDQLKIDMALVREVDRDGPKQAIIRAILSICLDLGIDVIAEGVESRDEYAWLRDNGVALYQGYLFARPLPGQLPEVTFPG